MRLVLFLILTGFLVADGKKGLSYNYVQATIDSSSTTFKDQALADIEGNGMSLSGSYSLSDKFALKAGYGSHSYDLNIETDSLMLGAVFHRPIASNTDILFDFSLLSSTFKSPAIKRETSNGKVIGVGLRSQVARSLELGGGISYVTLQESSTEMNLYGLIGAKDGVQFSVELAGSSNRYQDVSGYAGFEVRANF